MGRVSEYECKFVQQVEVVRGSQVRLFQLCGQSACAVQLPGFSAFEWVLLGPVLIGCVYSVLCLGAVLWYLRRPVEPPETGAWPVPLAA